MRKIKSRFIGKFSKKKRTGMIIVCEVLAVVLIISMLGMGYADTKSPGTATSANDVITGVNASMISANLQVEDSLSSVVDDAKEEKELQEKQDNAIAAIKQLGENCASHGFTYSWNADSGSYSAALNGSRKVNCTQFASWGLQAMGILPAGQTIYFQGRSIRGNGAGTIKSSSKVSVSYPNAHPASLNLEPGDVCYFGKGSGIGHTMAYAGKDSAGNMMWFSAGGGDVRSKSYGPKYKGNYSGRNVYVLIRINYDNL